MRGFCDLHMVHMHAAGVSGPRTLGPRLSGTCTSFELSHHLPHGFPSTTILSNHVASSGRRITMVDFENAIQEAIAAHDVPGCALVASNRDGTQVPTTSPFCTMLVNPLLIIPGSFHYAKAFGKASLKQGSERPLALNTILWTASCTKLMTSLCCLQLVERGLVSLDEPVYKHIPELESFNVLSGFDADGAPVEAKHTKPITLRLLLTHSSGLTYDAIHPMAAAWMQYHKRPMGASGKLLERFNVPLMFEPGDSWIYGASTDYAGLVVERVTGKTLEGYMKSNLWEPLGIKDMTFHPSKRPDLKERMAHMSLRDPETGKVRHTDTVAPQLDSQGNEYTDCLGGQGVFTSAEEYLKLLRAVLVCDEDEKLLTRQTLDMLFAPQLGSASSMALNGILQNDMVS